MRCAASVPPRARRPGALRQPLAQPAEGEDGDVVVPVGVGDGLGEIGEDVVEVRAIFDVGEQVRGGGLEALEPDLDALAASFDETVGVEEQYVVDEERCVRGAARDETESV